MTKLRQNEPVKEQAPWMASDREDIYAFKGAKFPEVRR